jgi:Tol biopolymer transport system component
MKRFYALMACLCLWASVGTTQDLPPLNAPLLLLNSVRQDHIVLYDLTMNATRRLDLGERAHMAWGFAPDGCAFIATVGNALIRSDLRGVSRILLENNAPDGEWGIFEPTWSPDGSKIAFTLATVTTNASGESQRQTTIAWIPANGGSPTLVPNSQNAYNPQWSPDGEWLAYIRYEQRVAGADIFATAVPTNPPPQGTTPDTPTLLNEADLWVTSADNSNTYRLTDFATGNVTMPRWSPDGSLISFVYSPSPNNDMFWMIANTQGAIPTQLSYEWVTVLDTTWLPDGTAIIGSAMRLQGVAQNRLWRVPLVGRADSDATLYLNSNPFSHEDYPRFSADGRYLATRTSYALAILDLTRNTQTVLFDEWALGNTPAIWSPKDFMGEARCG